MGWYISWFLVVHKAQNYQQVNCFWNVWFDPCAGRNLYCKRLCYQLYIYKFMLECSILIISSNNLLKFTYIIYKHTYTYIYIYIYIFRIRSEESYLIIVNELTQHDRKLLPTNPFKNTGADTPMPPLFKNHPSMREIIADNNLEWIMDVSNFYWLVVSTHLTNISQLGWLFPIYGKIKHVLPIYVGSFRCSTTRINHH